MTTPSARPFTPASRKRRSTGNPGRPEPRRAPRSFGYIEGWNNPRRRHSTLGYLSPIEFERNYTELAQLALEAPISPNRSSRRFRCPRPDLSRERPRRPNRFRSGRDGRRSRDERQRVASPTRSHRTSSLIQQSTTTAKTSRPNRGRGLKLDRERSLLHPRITRGVAPDSRRSITSARARRTARAAAPRSDPGGRHASSGVFGLSGVRRACACVRARGGVRGGRGWRLG